MKKFDLHLGAVCGVTLFVSAVFGLGSCSDAEGVMNSEIEGSSGCVPVRVHVSDFSFSVDDFPGTFDPSTGSGSAEPFDELRDRGDARCGRSGELQWPQGDDAGVLFGGWLGGE